MERLILYSLLIFTVALSGCKKGISTTSQSVHKGVVMFNICGNIAIQTMSPDYLGQDIWVSDTSVYHHVFAVQNSCKFGNHNQGDTISFTVIAPQVQNCAQCMVYVAVPDTTIPIYVN